MTEVWFILTDGSVADPSDVSIDNTGILRHESGIAVAYKPSGPRAREASGDEIKAYRSRDMAVESPKRTYNRRDMKAKD